MIGKMLHIGKNGNINAYLGAAAKSGKFLQFFPSFKLANSISST